MKESKGLLRAVDGLRITALLALVTLIFNACKEEITQSLYDPNYQSKPAPAISSISPTSGLAGLTTFTITGTNFSATKEENTVLFDAVTAQVVSASATQLTVKAPNLPKDSIKVTVTVFGADKFSNIVLCKLAAAVAEFGNIQSNEEPWGITCDKDGNVYVSLISGGLGVGVKKFTPDGVRSDYSPPPPGVPRWSSLKIGPGGYLYAARIVRAMYQIPPGGGSASIWVSSGVGTLYDFDFDAQANIWAGGNNTAIYRIRPDKSVKAFPFTANVRAVRIYGNYVYLGARVDTSDGVWRFPIVSADSLGPAEKYFDFTASYGVPGAGIYAITFASDGDLYIGTDGPDAIILVHPNKAWEPFYPGLLSPRIFSFAWGKGTELYATRERFSGSTQTLLRINTQKTGAPYYGRE